VARRCSASISSLMTRASSESQAAVTTHLLAELALRAQRLAEPAFIVGDEVAAAARMCPVER
jgi:hypothetical protein